MALTGPAGNEPAVRQPADPAPGEPAVPQSPDPASGEPIDLPRHRAGPGLRVEALSALVCLTGVAVLGVPVGLLWRALAPRAVALVSNGSVYLVNSETKAFIAADGTLFLLSLAGGVLAAAAAWWLARDRGVGTLLGLVAGAGLAAYLAWRTGLLGQDRQNLLRDVRAGRVAGRVDLPLQLRARPVLLAWPASAALTWLGLILWRSTAPPATGRAQPDLVASRPHTPADEPGPAGPP